MDTVYSSSYCTNNSQVSYMSHLIDLNKKGQEITNVSHGGQPVTAQNLKKYWL